MKKNLSTSDKIGPDWGVIAMALIGFACVIYVAPYYPEGFSLQHQAKFPALVVLSCGLLFYGSKSFHINEKGITRLRFAIPYKFIAWEQISQVGRQKIGNRRLLIITLSKCEKFYPDTDHADFYAFKHPFKTIVIPDVKKNLSIISKYYNPLDYDCSLY